MVHSHPASVLLPASPDSVQPDTFLQHPHLQTLFVATGLTGLAPTLVDFAIIGTGTRVVNPSLNRSFEESLARFAGGHTVVESGCNVAANQTRSLGTNVVIVLCTTFIKDAER